MKIKIIKNDIFFKDIAQCIAEGERVLIRAKGNSMMPFIRDEKDKIHLDKPNEESFRKGKLLLVKLSGDNYILHRVIKTEYNSLIKLKGDGNLSTTESCHRNNVIAEATEVIRNGKNIKNNSFRWKLYQHLWPNSPLLRRVLLGIYRRIYR